MEINLLPRRQTVTLGTRFSKISPLLGVAAVLIVGGLGWRIELAHHIASQEHRLQVMQAEIQKAENGLQLSGTAQIAAQLNSSVKQVQGREPDLGPVLVRIMQLLPAHATVSSLKYQAGVFQLSGSVANLTALSSYEQSLLGEQWVKTVEVSGATSQSGSLASSSSLYQYQLVIDTRQSGTGGTGQ